MQSSRPWLVMKFGGTSVATAERWQRIIDQTKASLPTHRVCIVASALSQVSNLLEKSMEQALAKPRQRGAYEEILARHQKLAQDLHLSAEDFAPVCKILTELGQLLDGVALTEEASPRLQARIFAAGELASTHLGRAALHKAKVQVARLDAREVLTASPRPNAPLESAYLDAEVEPTCDPARVEALVGNADCIITQGFIARLESGATCLLGRGGSDTSGALFGALLGAARIEIWTDVHGLFTADPRRVPTARLVKHIGYREAQELAAMGAKVLHPRALNPARWGEIPIAIRHTDAPDAPSTLISGQARSEEPGVMAVVQRSGVTMLTIETLDMWGAHGFLAEVFDHFRQLGISVDLVATSQAAVSLTIDRLPGGTEGQRFSELIERLNRLGRVRVVQPTAVVSIVGRRIRTVLHQLGPAFSVFREHAIHLVSESSEDLNFSFVVDEGDAPKLVASLHARLVPAQGAEDWFGPTFARLARAERSSAENLGPRWWRLKRAELLQKAGNEPCFFYDLATVRDRAESLTHHLKSLGQIYYAMKANPHPAILQTVKRAGLALECVSAAEVQHVRAHLGSEVPILFTPNFCPIEEYATALELGAEVTIDGPHLLAQAPEIFRGREFALRLDPGEGLGHHDKVKTAGANAKFGEQLAEAGAVQTAAQQLGARVVGLHAHVGSGIHDPQAWARTGRSLSEVVDTFPDLRWLDLGGGLGVVERPGQSPLDLALVQESLKALQATLPRPLELRMEPGRYLVSEAGVLVAPVTQVRNKGGVRFVGLATGMNSLLRPALYGAWHGIHNLSALDDPADGYAHVVGPICETGDVLGRDRLLPKTKAGDLLVIENCGAYGRVMSSSYNLRPPATEIVLTDTP